MVGFMQCKYFIIYYLPKKNTILHLHKNNTCKKNIFFVFITISHGPEWTRRRSVMDVPLQDAITQHVQGICESCDMFTQKIYNMRNYQDEIPKDLVDELNKWAFDCMGK